RRRHTSWPRDWSSDVCSSDLASSIRPGARGLGVLELFEIRAREGIGGIDRGREPKAVPRRPEVARAKMSKTRVGQISGVVRPKGRGLIEEANGVAVRPRCQERDPELVERIGLLGNELENAAERGCRGRMIV